MHNEVGKNKIYDVARNLVMCSFIFHRTRIHYVIILPVLLNISDPIMVLWAIIALPRPSLVHLLDRKIVHLFH